MQQATLVVQNDVGLHARPAARFVKLAKQFKSSIMITSRGKTVSAKSLVMLLSLAIAKDGEFELSAEGEDEQDALTALSELVNNKFAE
ncbi:MAG: HPr family phosphocarrier protein [Ktedonobacteraceae bacterium]